MTGQEPQAGDDGAGVEQLIERCLKGDDTAKAELFNTYNEMVRRAVARKLASFGGTPIRADVEDIGNEIFASLFENNCRKLGSIKQYHSINAWLCTIARNYTIDYVRKWKRKLRTRIEMEREIEKSLPPSPEKTAIENETVQEIRRLLSSLPSRDRLALELYYIQALKYAEIAEITGQNINTVAARIRRAKIKLRKLIEENTYGRTR